VEVSSCICCFTPRERIDVTHRTAGWAEPRFGLEVSEKRNTLEDSDLMGCDTVVGEWLPTLGSSRRILGCLTLKMKAT